MCLRVMTKSQSEQRRQRAANHVCVNKDSHFRNESKIVPRTIEFADGSGSDPETPRELKRRGKPAFAPTSAGTCYRPANACALINARNLDHSNNGPGSVLRPGAISLCEQMSTWG